MKKLLINNISFLLVTGFLYSQHFLVDLEATGESQLTIFSNTITNLNPGDEVGIFDLEGITNYNDCSNQIGEVLVGSGIWNGNQLDIVSTGSVDLCAFGGPQLSGFVEGNNVVVRVWKPDEQIEYETVLTWGIGSGLFGDILQSVSEITLGSLCQDDNEIVSGFGGCAAAVAALGCSFPFGGVLISEICPDSCNECEVVIGCTDENACNYNVFANEDNNNCIYEQDLDSWCNDTDGDGLGYGTEVFSCSQPFVDEFIFSWVQDCSDIEPDCQTNDTDNCGVCAGENMDQDCAGICFGDSIVDCTGVCEGDAVVDECGDCNGNGINEGECDCNGTLSDCAGECAGNATFDCAGICNGLGVSVSCTELDNELWTNDTGDNNFLNCGLQNPLNPAGFSECMIEDGYSQYCSDCFYDYGVCIVDSCFTECGQTLLQGEEITEECNVCLYINCVPNLDLCAEWGSDSCCESGQVDECGICNGDNSLCSDCAGIPNGNSLLDNCDVCDSDSSNDCVQDCLGEWGGGAVFDDCSICNGPGAIYDCGCYESGEDGLCITYQEIQNIFNTNCTTYCHVGGGSYQGNLDLSSYNDLMLGTSDHGPVIVPFESQSSILIQKLSDNPPFGYQMPRDGIPLDEEVVDMIELWINEGANPPENNSNCGNSEFECGDGSCIDTYFLCDGYPDCFDYSDETDCGGGSSGGTAGGTTGGGDDGGLEPFGELGFGNINFENKTVEILMNCIYPVSNFNIDISGIVISSAYGGDAESLNFEISTTNSNVSGSSTGEYIPSNNGLLTILNYDDTNNDQICFEYSSITTYIGIEYEAILGDCINFPNIGEELVDLEWPLHYGNNLVSFYALPDNASIENMMSSLNNVTGVIGEGIATTYINGDWLGSLSEINPTSGYWLKLLAEDTLRLFDLNLVNPASIYNLHEGMNLVSFPSRDSLGVSEAIPDIFESRIYSIIGEGVATSHIGENWFGSLTQFFGGRGYWMGITEDIDFNFENIDLSRIKYPLVANRYFPNKGYSQSSQQAFYFFGNIEGADIGDLIEVYELNTLVGSRVWNGPYTDIPAMGVDQSQGYTYKYCKEGSRPTFKLIKTFSGKEYWLEGDVSPWKNNELFISSQLKLSKKTPYKIGIDSIYPNPFNPSTNISFQLPSDAKVKIEVYDISGSKICNLYNDYKQKGDYSINWDASEYPSGIYFIKLVVGDYINTEKIMLIK